MELLDPAPGETILDAGCGTGVFTIDILSAGAGVVGLDISLPMLLRAREKMKGYPFREIAGDLLRLPFRESVFDRTVSVTAFEFVQDAGAAMRELFRVTRKGGTIVVATLNGLSPWQERRRAEAEKGHSLFREAIFRTPDELRSIAPVEGVVRTAIHFRKEDSPERAVEIERAGAENAWMTGAFVAGRWEKI